MKIIAVNISKTRHNNSLIQATERAWVLNINRARKYSFLIGVSNNTVHSYFKISNINIDNSQSNRVKFNLIPCSNNDQINIDNHIKNKGISLNKFTTKYID